MELKDILNIFSYKRLKKLIQIILNCLIAVKVSGIKPQFELSNVISHNNLFFLLYSIAVHVVFYGGIGVTILTFINYQVYKIKAVYIPVDNLKNINAHPRFIKWMKFLKIISDNKYMGMAKEMLNNAHYLKLESIELLIMLIQLGYLLSNIYIYILCALLLVLFSVFSKPLSFAEKNKELFIYILNNERNRNS